MKEVCAICGRPADGPMLGFDTVGDRWSAHAGCVAWRLRELVDPEWEPGCHREPLPLPQGLSGESPCPICGGREPLAVADCWLNLPGVEGKPAKEWVRGLTVYPPAEGSILQHIQVPVRVLILPPGEPREERR